MATKPCQTDEFALSDRSEAVLKSLVASRVLPSPDSDGFFDELDAPVFDETAFLNKLLPNSESLEHLPAHLQKIDVHCKALDEEIRSGIREAACSRARTRTALNDTRDVVSDLFEKINAISSKSQSSRQLVADICSDIQTLDTAKKNLTATITALKRLHMLSSAVVQLKATTAERDFSRAANLLEAVQALEIHFSNVLNVPKLKELARQTEECRVSLRSAVFEVFGAAAAGTIDKRQELAEACGVVAVLGADCRSALIDSIIRRQIEPYRAIFTPSEISGSGQVEDACFEKADQRFIWFKRQIRSFSERFRDIFPRAWNVPGLIAEEFCTITNQHLKTLLKVATREEDVDIALVVKLLTQTITFEKELQRHYSNINPDDAESSKQLSSEDTDPDDSFRKNFKSVGTWRHEVLNDATKLNFLNSISSCFQPFIGYYAMLEDKNMTELVQSLSTNETWLLTMAVSTSLQRYKGSDQLFLYIKNSMRRCCHLDQRELLMDVQKVYQSGLTDYCSLLASQARSILRPEPSVSSGQSVVAAAPVVLDLTHLQMQSLGVLINTAEYCSETLPQLQESMSKAARQETDFTLVQESFDDLISKTLEEIVAVVLFQADRILGGMAKLPLATMDAVGDTSQFVPQLRLLFQEKISSLSAVISAIYHHVFCSRLMSNFLPKYMLAILRCKRINDFGAQQLLLDTVALKTVLLGLPSSGRDFQADLELAKKRPPKAYTSVILQQLGKTEAILKTVSASTDTLAETYSTLYPNGHQADLTRIMELKGLKKSEQQRILKTYNGICPVQTQSEPLFKEDASKKFYLF